MDALPSLPETSLWKSVPALDQMLTQVTEAQNASYIAIVPDDIGGQILPGAGKTAGQCFDMLQTNVGLMHKWRNGVLLFNYQIRFYGDDALSPYAVVKRLREKRKQQAGDFRHLLSPCRFARSLVRADGVGVGRGPTFNARRRPALHLPGPKRTHG